MIPVQAGHTQTGYLGYHTYDPADTFRFPQTSRYGQSAVYNARWHGTESGWNPYYARTTMVSGRGYAPPRSHINLRNQLDYQIWRNPGLLVPRHNTNFHRQLRGFREGYFSDFYRPNGITGDIRTGSITSRLHS